MYHLDISAIGWIAAEVGRQPWVVFGVESMRTANVASPSVSAGEILASLIMFALLYSLMFVLWVYLLGKAIRKGPQPLGETAGGREATA